MLQRLLAERDGRLLESLRAAQAPPRLLQLVADRLEADRRERRLAETVPRRLGLTEPGRALLAHLAGGRLTGLQGEARHLLEKLAAVHQEREDLERAGIATPGRSRHRPAGRAP